MKQIIDMFGRQVQLAFVLGLVFLMLLIGPAQANDNAVSLRCKRWTTEEGLPQNRISCLRQTRDGSLWIGTWFGLSRFDGLHFTTFTKANTPELGDDAIKFLVEDNSGNLWIGTANGVTSYRNRHFQRLGEGGYGGGKISRRRSAVHMASASSGELWVRFMKSVQQVRDGKVIRTIDLPRAHSASSIIAQKSGGLVLVNDPLWLELSPQGTVTTNRFISLPDCEWHSIAAHTEKSFWLGTSAGLFFLEKQLDGSVQAIRDNALGETSVDFVFQDRSSNVWANVAGTLKRGVNANRTVSAPGNIEWEEIRPQEEIGATIHCMEEDADGNFWIGTERGLFQLLTPQVRVFTSRDGLPHDNVRSVCEAKDGTIWCYTDKGLARIQDNRVTPFAPNRSWRHHRTVYPGKEGGVWVANHEFGIEKIQNHKITKVIEPESPSKFISTLYEDFSGRLWVGTQRDVTVLDGGKTFSGEALTGKPLAEVRSILEARDETFWFGSKGKGLIRWRDGEQTLFTDEDGLGSRQIWAIHEDADGALWLGGDNGLTRYKDGKFFAFHRTHGLREETINCILEDDSGSLWLSGLQGIYRITLAELNAVAEGRANVFRCITFGTADGMESAETNGETQPAGWKARDGRLWFPTIRGLVVINPATIGANISPTPAIIEKIKADGQNIFGDAVDQSGEIGKQLLSSITPRLEKTSVELALQPAAHETDESYIFSPGHGNVIEFQYTANSLANPNRTRFRYRLEGAGSDWHEETTERNVRFFDLQPGNYCFQVVAADHHGLWSAQPATFAFSIVPHFWQTWPFYLVCGLGLIQLIRSIHSYRLSWQRRVLKLDHQRTLANDRARIARDLHDDLGTALTGLALEIDVAGRDSSETHLVKRLDQTATRARQLAERMREVVWTVNPRCDTVASLVDFLQDQVSQFLRVENLHVHFDFPDDIPPLALGAEARYQVALGVREAMTNVIRHANATKVNLGLRITGGILHLWVKDNGKGFDSWKEEIRGLSNMRKRIEQLGGRCECKSSPGSGTEIHFHIPVENR